VNQTNDAADQQRPTENQDGRERRGYIEHDAANTENGERDCKKQKPSLQGANLLDTGRDWNVVG
jgi:hypothetical protein